MQRAAGPAEAAGFAGLRPVHQGEPPVQPARRPRRDQRDRARRLYRPRPRTGKRLLRGVVDTVPPVESEAALRKRAAADPAAEILAVAAHVRSDLRIRCGTTASF